MKEPDESGGIPPFPPRKSGKAEEFRPPVLLTILETVYHQTKDRDPSSFGRPHEIVLSEEEQPYVRETTCGTEWKRLDLGWVTSPVLVLIDNLEKQPVLTATLEEIPTIEVAFSGGEDGGAGMDPVMEVWPGNSVRFRPAKGKGLCLRCRGGKARYSVLAIQG